MNESSFVSDAEVGVRRPHTPTLTDYKSAQSFRRHDGTLTEKYPSWRRIKEIEDKRREILRRVSSKK